MRYLPFVLTAFASLAALPTGPQVVSGSADMVWAPEVLEILIQGDRSIIDWQQFDIGAQERVRFQLEEAGHCTLNRVLSKNPSQIFGSLESNGKLILINTHGIVFGESASIDVGSLIASTLDLQNRHFIEETGWAFASETAAKIENSGKIRAKEGLVLLSRDIHNKGAIYLSSGTAAFGASDSLHLSGQTLALKSQNGLGFFEQAGSIRADCIEIAVDGTLYETSFRHLGTTESGRISLHVQAGDAWIDGTMRAPGGKIELFGRRISLESTGEIDVSARSGGGTVLFGGDYQGKGNPAQNADWIIAHPGSWIRADAEETGDGGRIILWSETATQFFGNLSAQGGPLSGNGGFAEVSSRGALDFHGTTHLRAELGAPGSLLLDPTQITIGGATSMVASGACGFPANTFAATAIAGTLDPFAITTALTSPANVTVTTSDGTCGPFGGTGNIIVNGAIVWAMGGTLSLNAVGSIIVNAAISSAGPGSNISLNAGTGIQVLSAIRNTDAVTGASISVISNTGDILVGPGVGVTSTIGTTLGPVLVRASAGNIVVTGGAGLNNSACIGPSLVGGTSDGTITVEAAQNLSLIAGDAAPNSSAVIGRCTPTYAPTCLGDINVAVGGNLLLRPGSAANGQHAIVGHGVTNLGSVVGTAGSPLTISVNVLGTVEMQSRSVEAMFPFSRSIIGSDTGIVGTINANLRMNVGGNLLMYGTAMDGPHITLGFNTTAGPSATSTQIHVVGNMVVDGRNSEIFLGPTQNMGVSPPNPEFFIHCLGDILFLSSMGTGALTPNPLFDRVVAASRASFTSHLWSAGSIICLNGSANVSSIFQDTTAAGNQLPNCSVRSVGDIIQGRAQTFTSNGTGSASGPAFSGFWIEADACFAAGELWAAQSATVNGVNIFSSSSLGAPSPAFTCNGSGAVGFDSTLYDLTVLPTPYTGSPQIPLTAVGAPSAGFQFSTVGFSGNNVLHSSSQFAGELFHPAFAAGTTANLNLGPSLTPNRLVIQGGTGNIEISGSNGPTLSACGCVDSFANITINATGLNNPWTTGGSVFVSALDNLSVLSTVATSGAGQPISLIADLDDSGGSLLTLSADVTSAGGAILLDAGFGTSNTSSITQNAGAITSSGGAITAQAANNILFSGTSPTSVNSGTGNISATAFLGTIDIDENIVSTAGNIGMTAGTNINVNPPGGTSVAGGSITTAGAGTVSLTAANNITVNGDTPTSISSGAGAITLSANNQVDLSQGILSLSGPISITSDADDSGTGDLNFLTANANVTTTNAAVTLDAGFGSGPGGTSAINQNFATVNSGGGPILAQAVSNIFISGNPVSFTSGAGSQTIHTTNGNVQIDETVSATTGSVSVIADIQDILLTTLTGTGGNITTTSGDISLDAGRNIVINGAPVTLSSTTGRIDTLAGDNTAVTTNVSTAGFIQMVTGNDMSLFGTADISSSGSGVTLVVDNDFPAAPLIGLGFFYMEAGAQVNSVDQLRIYTAQQPFNTILGLLNGNLFARGTLFQNSNSEVWCTYFDDGTQGTPFTVYYKNCLQQAMAQANLIVSEFLFTITDYNLWPFHGYNEYYGWPTKFYIVYNLKDDAYLNRPVEPYFIGHSNVLLISPMKEWERQRVPLRPSN
jgi:filamentous hemagglutinin family protein